MKLLIFLIGTTFCYYSISEDCVTDQDCTKYNTCVDKECHHSDEILFDTWQVVGFISILFGSALSNSGGIGGGGLYVPILIMILNFYTHEAIPISKTMTFCGTITAFILNLKLHHPSRSTVAIDYNIAKLIVPFLLFGTVIGITLNRVTSSFIILFVMTFMLFYNTYKTFRRAFDEYNLENETKLLKTIAHKTSDRELTNDEKLINIELNRDMVRFPLHNYLFFFLAYISTMFITLLRGSEGTDSIINIEYCSKKYWLMYLAYIPVALIFTLYSIRRIRKEYAYRLSIGFPYDKYDMHFNSQKYYQLPLVGLIVGTLSGLLGIGGGLFICPILLIMGVNAITATCTSNFLMLFTSSSTSIQFFLHGMTNIPYSIACAFFSILGSLIGTLIIHYILVTTNRQSVRILPLAIVILICSILLPGFSLYEFIRKPSALFDFNSPC